MYRKGQGRHCLGGDYECDMGIQKLVQVLFKSHEEQWWTKKKEAKAFELLYKGLDGWGIQWKMWG